MRYKVTYFLDECTHHMQLNSWKKSNDNQNRISKNLNEIFWKKMQQNIWNRDCKNKIFFEIFERKKKGKTVWVTYAFCFESSILNCSIMDRYWLKRRNSSITNYRILIWKKYCDSCISIFVFLVVFTILYKEREKYWQNQWNIFKLKRLSWKMKIPKRIFACDIV